MSGPRRCTIETIEKALALRATWMQRDDARERVPPGRYLVRAMLLTDGAPLESPTAPLEIRAG